MYEIDQFVNNLFRAAIIPGFFIALWLSGLIAIGSLKLSLLLCFTIFVILPIIFRYSVTLQRSILFLTFVAYPRNVDFKVPASLGLYATRNFYVQVKDNDVENVEPINIGVWHILPIQIAKRFSKEFKIEGEALEEVLNSTDVPDTHLDKYDQIIKSEFPTITKDNEKFFFERILRQPGSIVLYLHGNTGSRAAQHRVDLFKVLRKLGYHVLALDYRGYGDSDKVQPTEEGVVRDAMAVYEYIKNQTNNPVFLWGHSLGTGVSTHMLAILNQMNIPGPRAVVLESPFNNIRDEIRQHPFSKLFKNLPWFDLTIVKPMYTNSLRFESDQHVNEFRQPILILHAEDDLVVPFQLGYKLYRAAIDNRGRSWGPVEFHRFEGSSHYGHKFLCHAPNLPEIVKTFFDNYRDTIY